MRKTAIAMVASLALAAGLAEAGTKAEGRDMLERGLAWLAKQQNGNGSFGMIPGSNEEGDVGITALAVSAFADSPADLREKHAGTLSKAVAYLVSKAQPNGAIGEPAAGLGNYRTSLGILALCKVDKKAHADLIAKARDYIIGIQFHEGTGVPQDNPHYGGFGYDKSNTKPDADMSNTQFALEALKAAGVEEDSEVFQRALIFLQRSQDSEANDLPNVKVQSTGGFFYDPALSRDKSEVIENPDGTLTVVTYASMTYAGLKSMIYAGLTADDPRVAAALDWIRAHYTLEENFGLGTRQKPENAQQGLYYYYVTFARALDATGMRTIETDDGETHSWTSDLIDALKARQRAEGLWVNSVSRWWEQDPVLVTAYACEALALALRNMD